MLLLVAVASRDGFVASMGGADAACGTTGRTVGDLADALESALERLLSPGYRVYDPTGNRDRFWRELIGE
jgi:hypothetical protein